MLRMPIVHTPPPVYSPAPWQQTTAQLDQFEQVDHTAPRDLIWRGEGSSTTRAFSPLLGFMGRVTCTLLFASFLTLSGCKKFDELVGARKTETTNTSSMRALSDSDLFISKSRTVRLKPNRELSKRLRNKLEGEAYHRAKALIAKDVKPRIRQAFPIDCRGHKIYFKMDWNYLSYELETVRTLGNGTRVMRILCKTTWENAWCQRRYRGNRAQGVRGSKIPYSITNPALR